MQRIAEYPLPRFLAVVVAIEIVDIETARVGDQLRGLGQVCRIQVGLQLPGSVIVDVQR